MHYRAEIVMPPSDDVLGVIEKALAPFSENNEGEDCEPDAAFWDFFVIGGRWAGSHLQDGLDQDRLQAFNQELQKRKVTVSGLQFGAQELSPADQIPMVDALWKEYFPDWPGDHCPLFKHGLPDQYSHQTDYPDVMPLEECLDAKAERCILINTEGRIVEMLATSLWNGVTHQKTTFDGTIRSLLKENDRFIGDRDDEYANNRRPEPDWVAVTIDYHT